MRNGINGLRKIDKVQEGIFKARIIDYLKEHGGYSRRMRARLHGCNTDKVTAQHTILGTWIQEMIRDNEIVLWRINPDFNKGKGNARRIRAIQGMAKLELEQYPKGIDLIKLAKKIASMANITPATAQRYIEQIPSTEVNRGNRPKRYGKHGLKKKDIPTIAPRRAPSTPDQEKPVKKERGEIPHPNHTGILIALPNTPLPAWAERIDD